MELGTWKAKSIGGALGMTSTGKEQVAVEFEFTEGPNMGQRMTWHGYFTDKTTERTFESLRIAGWRGQDLDDLSDLSRSDVPEVALVLKEEPYEGKMQTKIAWVNRVSGIALKSQLDPNAAKSFAARMKAQIIAFDAKQGQKPAQKQRTNGVSGDPRPEPPPVGPPGDDLPF